MGRTLRVNLKRLAKPCLDWRYSPPPPRKTRIKKNVISITINSIAARFEVGCKLNLMQIAQKGWNTDLKNGVVTIRMRLPEFCLARIFPSGKVTVDVRTHDPEIVSKRCRNFARLLQKLKFPVRYQGFRIFNIKATTSLNYRINLTKLAKSDRNVDYHPEISPAAFYKLEDYSTSLTILHTGSVNIFCKSNIEDIIKAIEFVEEKFYPFRIDPFSVNGVNPLDHLYY